VPAWRLRALKPGNRLPDSQLQPQKTLPAKTAAAIQPITFLPFAIGAYTLLLIGKWTGDVLFINFKVLCHDYRVWQTVPPKLFAIYSAYSSLQIA